MLGPSHQVPGREGITFLSWACASATYFKLCEQSFHLCNYTSFGKGDKLVPKSVSNSTQLGSVGSSMQYLCQLDDKGQALTLILYVFVKKEFCSADSIQRRCIACAESPEQVSKIGENTISRALFLKSSFPSTP